MARLTDKGVLALQPRPKRYIEFFADGIGVRVAPTGRKTFVYWFRHLGKQRLMTLGTYPAMSVKDALDAHGDAQKLQRNKVDPVADAKAKTAKARAANVANKKTLRGVVAAMEKDRLFAAKASKDEIFGALRRTSSNSGAKARHCPLATCP